MASQHGEPTWGKLFITVGDDTTVRHLTKSVVKLGRAPSKGCDVVFDKSPAISGLHCELRRVERDGHATQCMLVDCSSNGTFVESQKVHRAEVELHDGDVSHTLPPLRLATDPLTRLLYRKQCLD
jgi:hypothetical protein